MGFHLSWESLVNPWDHKKICSQNFVVMFTFTNWAIKFANTSKNGMVVGLLVCTQEQGVSKLDEEISAQHFSRLHISKL
jgi:hypothetical protein